MFVSRPAGCNVSCLILSFPRVNQTENSTTLIPPPPTSPAPVHTPKEAATVDVWLSICHGWTGSTNSSYTSSFSVLNLSLSLSVSQRLVDK